ncbi:MAG: endopeptidase La [Oceanococcaceae bacterium]
MSNKEVMVPVLPLRDVVVFPHMAMPLFVGREKSVNALREAMQSDRKILLMAQRAADVDDPGEEDLYAVGTLANILQLLKLPDGTLKVLVEGAERAEVETWNADDDMLWAGCTPVEDALSSGESERDAVVRTLLSEFEQYSKLNSKVPAELLPSLTSIDDHGRLADTVAAHLNLRLGDRQKVLETLDVATRCELVLGFVEGEIEVMQVEKRIRGRVKSQMEKSQREYYLNEQMKAIQKELGESDDGPGELEELAQRIVKAGMPKAARTKAEAELNKLKMMAPMSAEGTVVRNYLDWMLQVPWKKRTRVKIDLADAQAQLDADHFGLEKVKERIVEYLAVQKRVKKIRGPILCLVGPPGVGKTSLGRSIAKSLNRKFVRMSLGGVRDEAEIRGHRRTYIGSLPGKIVQNLAKVESRNPLFLLDEIDKMANDFRGDPASAMLEVLDPEQNHSFNDHYLEVDLDLSDVMFVATANTLDIPGPLLDRMEVIRLAGYTEDEKLAIARRYLVPKQMEFNGLRESELTLTDAALLDIVRLYTREAGVRNLERTIGKICRKVVKQILEDSALTQRTVDADSLSPYLGVPPYRFGRADDEDKVGQVTGLAWTEVGGELLRIEAVVTKGKGRLSYTGSLGDVMQESIQAAATVVRARAEACGIDSQRFETADIHVHVPEGATPKDGPSAGIAMCTTLVSAFTGVAVRKDVAMTGEITLRGEVLPIGGLKEKLLAAHRGGITKVLIPFENEKDLEDIPENIKARLTIVPVRWFEQVLAEALVSTPEPLPPPSETVSTTPSSEQRAH